MTNNNEYNPFIVRMSNPAMSDRGINTHRPAVTFFTMQTNVDFLKIVSLFHHGPIQHWHTFEKVIWIDRGTLPSDHQLPPSSADVYIIVFINKLIFYQTQCQIKSRDWVKDNDRFVCQQLTLCCLRYISSCMYWVK